MVSIAMLSMCDPKEKQFPLNRKFRAYPNGGEPAMGVSSKPNIQMALHKGRLLQARMLSELVTHTLSNAIEDIAATVMGGGPPP